MSRGNRFSILIGAAIAGAMLVASPASAQRTPGYEFLQAVKERDGDKATELLKPGSTLVNSRDIVSGESGLHIVVEEGDLTWTRFLLQQGANPNIRDNNGVTPLVIAARTGFVDAVKYLADAGAKVDIADVTGETPLIAAVHRRDIPMMRELLKAGADPDRADSSGRTARDYALQDGPRSQLAAEIEKNEKPKSEREGAATYGPSL